MNKVFLIGNLTRDPELTETQSGVSVCRFAIAVNRRNGAEQKTDFYNITAWRGLGENVSRYARKGNKVAVCGNIELREYEDREGNKRVSVEVVAQEIEFLTPKAQEEKTEPKKLSLKPQIYGDIDDGDIPF